MIQLLKLDDLPRVGRTTRFDGILLGSDSSFFYVDTDPGKGPTLHQHPYTETFILLEGIAEFRIGDSLETFGAGEVLVAPANTPHKFTNTGAGTLRIIAIHAAKEIVTTWLDE